MTATTSSQVGRTRSDHRSRRVARVAGLVFAGLTLTLTTNVGDAAALSPNQTSMSGVVSALNVDINDFWLKTARAGGWTYTAPTRYLWFDGSGLPAAYNTACGRIDATTGPAYCDGHQELFLDKDLLDALVGVGDYMGGVILAHEWAHHIQWLRGHLQWARNSRFFGGKELQADCYAGVYTRSLAARGKLAANDLGEAQRLLQVIGDPAGMSPYDPKSHGSGAQRVYWFNQGYNTFSLVKCDSVYTWLYG